MSPEFTRDIRHTLLWILKNLHTTLLLRGYHPLWQCFPAHFESLNLGVKESKTPHLPLLS